MKNEEKEVEVSMHMGQPEGRQGAREVLRQSIAQSNKQLNGLETLEKSINWDILSDEQENALYYILTRRGLTA